MKCERTRLVALRGITGGLLLAWLVKWHVYVLAWQVYRLRPLSVPFFPSPLQTLAVATFAYCVPIVLGSCAVLWTRGPSVLAALLAFCVGSGVLLVHQDTYNDATFVTCFWVSLIGLWFHDASSRGSDNAALRLSYLTQLLIGLLFLGGFVGKLCAGYFDGSTLYRIYFADREHFTFAWLREVLSPAQLRRAALAYSWLVLCIEGTLATVPFWPARTALVVILFALVGLVILNNFLLASVICAPLALASVSLWLVSRDEIEPASARVDVLEVSP